MQVRIANRRAGGRAREALSPKLAAYDSLALRTSGQYGHGGAFREWGAGTALSWRRRWEGRTALGAPPAVVSHARTGPG